MLLCKHRYIQPVYVCDNDLRKKSLFSISVKCATAAVAQIFVIILIHFVNLNVWNLKSARVNDFVCIHEKNNYIILLDNSF